MQDLKEIFLTSVADSIQDDTFVKLTLACYRGGETSLRKIVVKVVALASGEHLSFVYRHATKDVTKNRPIADGLAQIETWLGSDFRRARVFTTVKDTELIFEEGKPPRLVQAKATHSAVPSKEHNRAKHRPIKSTGTRYLTLLGVTTTDGAVKKGMEAKYRQVNKFVEVFASLLRASPLRDADALTIVDMGCGKGYLTFALYDYLTNALHKQANITGVEARAHLVGLCNEVAQAMGFRDLHFEGGTIQSFTPAHTDVLIALHACNTATDDALFKAIKLEIPLILCAPCCHQELRPQLQCSVPGLKQTLKFGILLERQAELVTDGLRALLLEAFGYKTSVFEFISTEHTSKNLMIAATKTAQGRSRRAEIFSQLDALKRAFGIRNQALESLLQAEGLLGRS